MCMEVHNYANLCPDGEEVVRRQLGHSTPMLTLQTYGMFIPTGEDRTHWEREVTKAEKRRGESSHRAG